MSSSISRSMRKGTKSCLECRRRKARCIHSSDESRTCLRCKSRGTSCIEQTDAALREVPSTNTRVTVSKLSSKVEELEAIIKSISRSQQDVSVGPELNTREATINPMLQDSVSTSPIHDSLPASTSVSSIVEPIPSLFDSAIWSRDPMGKEAVAGAKEVIGDDSASSQKCFDTIKQLRNILPTPELLSLILDADAAKFWWNTWRAIAPWVLETTPEKYTKMVGGFVVYSLSSNEPSLVGMGLLCVAFSIQQLDSNHGDILRRLPSSQGKLFHTLFSNVEMLILNDAYFASTMMGLGVGVLAAKMLMSLGLVKKAWLLLHRSISYGQLLRLQIPHRLQSESEITMVRRQQTWAYLCELDLYTSLLIGLPYAASGCTIQNDVRIKRGTTSWFQSRLRRLSAQIIDRNQAGLELSTTLTQDLQRDAALAVYDMDREFWDAPNQLGLGRIDRLQYMENVALQLWYHQIRVFIHMPLMIKSIEDPLLEDHKIACLTGSREALRIYRIMRSDSRAAFSLEKLIDYQSFIYTTLLILGQFDLGTSPSGSQSPYHDRDWELVESTLDILRQASTTSNNTIAAQAVEGLEALASLARGSIARASQDSSLHVECEMNDCKVSVPFSGTITIFPGSLTQGSRTSPTQPSSSELPIFTLSNSTHEIPQLTQYMPQSVPQSRENEIPHIDFSWENMIEFNTDEDWSWLSDVG